MPRDGIDEVRLLLKVLGAQGGVSQEESVCLVLGKCPNHYRRGVDHFLGYLSFGGRYDHDQAMNLMAKNDEHFSKQITFRAK